MCRGVSRVNVAHRVSVVRGVSTVIRGIPAVPAALTVSMVRVAQARWMDREPGGRWVAPVPAVRWGTPVVRA